MPGMCILGRSGLKKDGDCAGGSLRCEESKV